MLILDALGSELEVKYKGESIKLSYRFPTAMDMQKFNTIDEDGVLRTDLHLQLGVLCLSLDGPELEIGKKGLLKKAEVIKIDDVKTLYKYPLWELQAVLAVELDKDLKKKYILTEKG